jgi:hypothetical protein
MRPSADDSAEQRSLAARLDMLPRLVKLRLYVECAFHRPSLGLMEELTLGSLATATHDWNASPFGLARAHRQDADEVPGGNALRNCSP